MDLRHPWVTPFAPAYAARIAEEETKLRWLVSRHPGNRELAYYLIFLLAANRQDVKALVECRRVLRCHPGDVVAEMWKELIFIRWHCCPPRSTSGRLRWKRHRWQRSHRRR